MQYIRHNPLELIDKLKATARGIRKHQKVWPHAMPSADTLEEEAEHIKAALRKRERGRHLIEEAKAELVNSTRNDKESAFGKLRTARIVARELLPDDQADFGIYKKNGATRAPNDLMPQELHAKEIFSGQVLLKWRSVKRGVVYQVFMGSTIDRDAMTMVHAGSQAKALVSDLTPGSKYFFAVRAVQQNMPSSFSPPIQVITLQE